MLTGRIKADPDQYEEHRFDAVQELVHALKALHEEQEHHYLEELPPKIRRSASLQPNLEHVRDAHLRASSDRQRRGPSINSPDIGQPPPHVWRKADAEMVCVFSIKMTGVGSLVLDTHTLSFCLVVALAPHITHF